MALPKAKKPITVEEAADAMNLILLGQESPITYEEAFKVLEEADTDNMELLNRQYYRFPKFGEYVFLVQNVKTTSIKGKPVEVVEILDKERNEFINGDKLLVSAAKELTQLPCFVRVSYQRDVPSKEGSYKDLKVYAFGSSTDKTPF